MNGRDGRSTAAQKAAQGCGRTIRQAMRPPFLLLTVSVIALTAAMMRLEDRWVFVMPDAWADFWIATLAALAAHAAVNLLNEYDDWRSGLDRLTTPTPFSGGSGALKARPDCVEAVGGAAWFAMGALLTLGLYLVWRHGWVLALLGILGVALVASYTPILARRALWTLTAPGLAFGFLIMFGVAWAVMGRISDALGLTAGVVFFLANNLLLLNQLPDRAADEQAGRRNLAIVAGEAVAVRVYELFWLSALALMSWMVYAAVLPLRAAWAALSLAVLGIATWWLLQRWLATGKAVFLHRALAANAVQAIGVPAILAGALWWAG